VEKVYVVGKSLPKKVAAVYALAGARSAQVAEFTRSLKFGMVLAAKEREFAGCRPQGRGARKGREMNATEKSIKRHRAKALDELHRILGGRDGFKGDRGISPSEYRARWEVRGHNRRLYGAMKLR
jgi:hypothetical protein